MKHKKTDRPQAKEVQIPKSVKDKVDALLLDPLSGRPEFGAWSKLVTALLRVWLENKTPVPIPQRKKPSFCHKCLLDKELIPTCNSDECPFKELS